MSKVLSFILIIFAGIGALYAIYSNSGKTIEQTVRESILPKVSPTPKIVYQQSPKTYLFVPYWTVSSKDNYENFDSVIYFGLGVNEKGIETKDKGFANMPKFIRSIDGASEKILAIRMIDAAVNAEVLKDSAVEEKIASDAVNYAKDNGFDAILLDFETSAFAFDTTISNISDFYTIFSKKTKDANLKFYVTLFGDTYFRTRAYDIKKIGTISDKVFIMTYDFHKSRGNPGPNFPLYGKEKYGYDMTQMVEDFQKDIDNEKLVLVLGFFGYDWRVDKGNSASSNGIPLSTNEIKKEFVDNCKYKSCTLKRLPESNEPFVSYNDNSLKDHVVWFDDEISVNKKIEYLKTRGILEIGYWAYSFF